MKLSNEYQKLTIHGKINTRDHRNALNINYLFATNLSDFKNGSTTANDPTTQHPRRPAQNFKRWGIYHK